MKATVAAALGAATLLLLPGCIDYDEVLTVAADGSGSLAIDMSLDLSFQTELKKLDPNPDGEDAGDVKSLLTKAEIQRACDAPGVTVKTCDVEDKGENKLHVKLAFDYKDLEALRAVRFFSDRELEVVENGANVDLLYRFNAKSALNVIGLGELEDMAPKEDRERKAKEIVANARKGASLRFAVKAPGKLVATSGDKADDKTARFVVDKTKPQAQAALVREPLKMSLTLAKADAPFWEKEVERKKKADAAKKPDDPAKPAPRADPGKE
jgi:hypothetical protein